jgi:hypothetical protein
MEDNNINNIEDEGLQNIEFVNSEINELSQLITLIVDYYCFKSENDPTEDEAEEWRKGTKYDTKKNNSVPTDIDKLIKLSFKKQIKKFI